MRLSDEIKARIDSFCGIESLTEKLNEYERITGGKLNETFYFLSWFYSFAYKIEVNYERDTLRVKSMFEDGKNLLMEYNKERDDVILMFVINLIDYQLGYVKKIRILNM